MHEYLARAEQARRLEPPSHSDDIALALALLAIVVAIAVGVIS